MQSFSLTGVAHGKTAELSPTLTSDGLYEGEDFVRIAAKAKAMGCPGPFWFLGYSLGGQLALWGVKAAQSIADWGKDLDLDPSELGGGAVICPNLDSNRSLSYLVKQPFGKIFGKGDRQGVEETRLETVSASSQLNLIPRRSPALIAFGDLIMNW